MADKGISFLGIFIATTPKDLAKIYMVSYFARLFQDILSKCYLKSLTEISKKYIVVQFKFVRMAEISDVKEK